jgi:type VI protein secretion system component VasK
MWLQWLNSQDYSHANSIRMQPLSSHAAPGTMEVSNASAVPQYSQLEVNPESLPEIVPQTAYGIKDASAITQPTSTAPRWFLRKINWLWIALVVVVLAALVGGLVGGLHKPPHSPPTG